MKKKIIKYFLHYGYFGNKGRRQISKLKAYFYRYFTTCVVYIEVDDKECWWDKG